MRRWARGIPSAVSVDFIALSAILTFMAIEVRKREGESPTSLLYSFTKRVRRSGVLREIRSRKFHDRPKSRIKRKLSAIHREAKRAEVVRMKKLGLL